MTYPNITRTSFLLLCLYISSIFSRGADDENRWSSQRKNSRRKVFQVFSFVTQISIIFFFPITVCGQLSYNGTTGTFHSPNYPASYAQNNIECRYRIHSNTSRILLAFSDFATEPGYDYVEVFTSYTAIFLQST